MDSPPRAPGLYELRHNTNGLFYIGKTVDLHRRYAEWRGVFSTGLGHKNAKLAAAMTHPADWTFNVLRVILDNTPLAPAEAGAIRDAMAHSPNLLLNVMLPDGKMIHHPAAPPKSTVTLEGRQISYAEAAEALGCSRETLAKRLAKYRQQGKTEVTLEHLLAMTEKWSGKIPELTGSLDTLV